MFSTSDTPLGIVESHILLNSDIYYNEKVGLTTRLDLVRAFLVRNRVYTVFNKIGITFSYEIRF
jgi:hypothetical protein